MSTLIHAHTETDYKHYPGFVNVSIIDGNYVIRVRSKESTEVSEIVLDEEEFNKMAQAVHRFYAWEAPSLD